MFALTVKLLVMALGLFGVASMWLAVFADTGVAMLCVLNAVRMLYMKPNDFCYEAPPCKPAGFFLHICPG